MNIILIGLSGCGKTSTGYDLAAKLNYNFIDLDEYIATKVNQDITKIFQNYGESYFREQESLALQEIYNKFPNNTVLSLGGGSFYGDNITLCQQYGITIWLNPSLEIIINRLNSLEIKKRPLLQNTTLKQKLELLLTKRKKYYQQANYCITINSKQTIATITNKIISLL